MLDHFNFIAKNSTAHKVNSHCTLAISYCTFCVEKHTILGPVADGMHNSQKIKIKVPIVSSRSHWGLGFVLCPHPSAKMWLPTWLCACTISRLSNGLRLS